MKDFDYPAALDQAFEVIKDQVHRIVALEDVLKKLTDLGDGCYVGWRGLDGDVPYCMYCYQDWDRHSETDEHTDDCPIAIARKLLEES